MSSSTPEKPPAPKYDSIPWIKSEKATYVTINQNDRTMMERPAIVALIQQFNPSAGDIGLNAVVDGHKLRMKQSNTEQGVLTVFDNGPVGSSSSGGKGKGGGNRPYWVPEEYFFITEWDAFITKMKENSTLWKEGKRNSVLVGQTRLAPQFGAEPKEGMIIVRERNIYHEQKGS